MASSYLVAVFRDRITAEEAYTRLEKAEFPLEVIAILGKGYKTADEFGLVDPKSQAIKQAKLMAIWLVPFGFVAGVTFSIISELQTFTAWAGQIGNHIIGGILGAIGGGMGSAVAGGSVGLTVGGGDALPYRNLLEAGQYLVVLRDLNGFETRKANDILRELDPEGVQAYMDPTAIA
ncbi:MAG: hypothetical protein AAGA67_08830 [Cyanobacteria bacterium P01_F01_bin.153]